MPELPEVETVRAGLAPLLVGHRITRLQIHDDRLVRPCAVADVEAGVEGSCVTAVRRRGKYLLIDLASGYSLEVHLRMTGSFSSVADSRAMRHVRATILLESGAGVVYRDPRRFGTFRLGPTDSIAAELEARLGPEPLADAFTADGLRRVIRNRRTTIKAVLLDQRVVAGLGNIYVDEALLLSGIHPARQAARIRVRELEQLVPNIRERLLTAIAAGGSTLRDYRGVEGADGTMQEQFMAYGRVGLPCRVCGTLMSGGRIAGRGTTWCSQCQPRSG
jgi:formamidopyrimidine-DNA glycosylase